MTYKKYFENKKSLLEDLEKIHYKKYELKKLIEDSKTKDPYIVEFSGLPRTGKSVCVDKVYEFFKKADFRIEKTKEPAQIIKEMLTKKEIKNMSALDFNNKTLEISRKELMSLGGRVS